ncbi:MAG TPA: TetR/AcrR family transcriptional regulator [Falsiroseomonas sp.]|jgi:TetR/AcrR family transcriptional repressor of nem operon|nr:TetR/AcrR family transcriptional regulator [Falsiroseomonas sp.]
MVTDTRSQLLQSAERLVRSRGYSAFSYADLSAEVGIRKASIHHHFPAKSDLGLALVEDYQQRFRTLLADIERAHPDSAERLRAYGALYAAGLRDGQLCLCGMLASNAAALPNALRRPVGRFFEEQRDWLERVVAAGQRARELRGGRPPRAVAESLLALLQGASLVGWSLQDPGAVERALEDALAGLLR